MNLLVGFFRRNQKILVWILIVACAIVGFFVAMDYGLSWDEPLSHYNGRVTLAYLRDMGDPDALLWVYSERYYGTLFDVPMAFAEDALGLVSGHEVFIFRHRAAFFLFLFGLYFFYLFCLKRFRSSGLALIGAIFLLFSPRIFADSFYNSKDLPFLVFFILSVFTLLRLLEKPILLNVFWHSFASALLIAIRVQGIFIIVLTAGFIFSSIILHSHKNWTWRKSAVPVGIYLLVTAGLTVLFWPFLWQNAPSHFIEALDHMLQFTRGASTEVFYLGEFITADKLPWHYILLWIIITTPLVYVALFFLGTVTSIRLFLEYPFEYFKFRKQDLIVLCWFFGPFLATIVFDSILYDGWRHLYFVYPALVYLSLVGIEAILIFLKKTDLKIQKISKLMLTFLIGVNLVGVASFMVRNHPYQNLYFNAFAGGMENARKNFDLDYWGLTFREGLEYIAENENDPLIPVYFAGGSPDTVEILSPEILVRFDMQKDRTKAKYILSNYRWQKYDELPFDKEVYSVKVEGAKVMSVFKMR